MKIKELFEDVKLPKSFYEIVLLIEYSSIDKEIVADISRDVNGFIAQFQEKTRCACKININSWKTGFTISVYPRFHNLDKLENYEDDIHQVLLDNFEENFKNIEQDKDDSRVEVLFRGQLPKLSEPLSFRTIYLEPLDIVSLEGVNEFIGHTDFLGISRTDKIVSHVLGLVALAHRGIHPTLTSTTKPKTKEWLDILVKYINGNKSVWKCQDELQDLDLDDYAQL